MLPARGRSKALQLPETEHVLPALRFHVRYYIKKHGKTQAILSQITIFPQIGGKDLQFKEKSI